MKPVPKPGDPCLQIQADLSAMLDGELDASSVRRVMVHSDVCPSCKSFLDGIRVQAIAHQDLHRCLTSDESEVIEIRGLHGQQPTRIRVAELRQKLTENRTQLARIFYELGRGFVLMGMSPNFSRIVACEPVPIPDMFQKGRNLIDEVERIAAGPGWEEEQGDDSQLGGEWVRAKSLFLGDGLRSPEENLAKGRELLQEALMLAPDYHEARIYLGHANHVAQEKTLAISEFKAVLRGTDDRNMRAFALLNLGNVFLEDGELQLAAGYFQELVNSGVVDNSPQFGLIYFNLALVAGLRGLTDECEDWLGKLYEKLPHKRRMIAEEIRSRPQLAIALGRIDGVMERFSQRFPGWFTKSEAC